MVERVLVVGPKDTISMVDDLAPKGFEVVKALHEAGLFRMLLPVSLGGGAADFLTFNQVIETIAAADASTAWCLAQTLASSHAAGYLGAQIAREVFGAPNAIVAWGPPAGLAKAAAVDGGYRVTGKWRFASGSANATWMGGHSTVFGADGTPRLDAGRRPLNRTKISRNVCPSGRSLRATFHTNTQAIPATAKRLAVAAAVSCCHCSRCKPAPLSNLK